MDLLPDVHILSRDLIRGVLRRAIPSRVHHVLSINNPDEDVPPEVRARSGSTLSLFFHDIPEPDTDLVAPTREDVRKIVDFARGISGAEVVLCHCTAGISRSSAGALTIIAAKLQNSRDGAKQVVAHVQAIKKGIFPNRRMVAYADDILGFDGALVEECGRAFGAMTL